jgi:hypothetical protein
MSAVYPPKGGIMGGLKSQLNPHIHIRPYIFGQEQGLGITHTVGAGRNNKLAKVSLGKRKIINTTQLGYRCKGIGEGLKIENIALSSVTSIQKLSPLLNLPADYLQSLRAYGGVSFNLYRRIPHDLFLICGSRTKLITKVATPSPVLITMWAGKTGIHRYSVDSLSIFLFKIRAVAVKWTWISNLIKPLYTADSAIILQPTGIDNPQCKDVW